MRVAASLACALVAVLTLGGCAMSDDHPMASATPTSSPDVAQTIHRAKQRTQSVEDKISQAAPNAKAVHQQETGTLFNCADGRWQWVGGTKLELTPGSDVGNAVTTIASKLKNLDGMRTDSGQDDSGQPNVEFFGDDGEGYLVSVGGIADTISIKSSSQCFVVPDDFSTNGSW